MFLSADFLSSYLSGAVGILIGNPLDILKVRLQAASRSTPASSSSLPSTESTAAATASTQKTTALRTFTHGTLAPLLTYGALNALLFVTYNRTLSLLSSFHGSNSPSPSNGSISSVQESSSLDPRLSDTFTAGVLAGLATWVVSTPTELLKCRVQLHSIGPEAGRRPRGEDSGGTWNTARHVWKREGIRGFYVGGTVTAIRDSIGYGF
ncbi:MAG: hypothetical protein M1834_006870 [Cirrosporium novae-zelandiae]|nr:MAG: hypothetical protein M1834_006870 [Cirrosporium novae-zelandiae]